MQTQAAQQQQREYFNLHLSGIGYLNRVRWVKTEGRGRKSEPYLACAISALRGSTSDTGYTYLDLRVCEAQAIELIDRLETEANDRNCKVVISFKVADIYPHGYERDLRDPQGRVIGQEWASLIKGRLILINHITVNGEVFYRRAESDHAHESSDESLEEPALNGTVSDGSVDGNIDPHMARGHQAAAKPERQRSNPPQAQASRPNAGNVRQGGEQKVRGRQVRSREHA